MSYRGEGYMETFCFDIQARFGSFTKPLSTSGGLLTYRVPPKTSIRGMLGSIAGFDFKETLSLLDRLKLGIVPLSETRTKTTTFNSHYGNPRGRMVNIKQEILINPSYRVITDFSEIEETNRALEQINSILEKNHINATISSIYDGYRHLLDNNISYYDLYMGRNNFPLELKTVDVELDMITDPYGNEFEAIGIVPHEISSDFKVKEKPKEDSGLNISSPDTLKFHILKDIPIDQKENREYTETKDFIMKSIGERVKLMVTPEKNDYDYKYLKNSDGKLYVLF